MLASGSNSKLPHHPGNAAWLAHGPRDAVLEITNGRRADIARSHIRPGAAAFLGFASLSAGFAARVGRQFEMPVVAAISIDAELRRSAFRLDDAGPAHPGHATRCLHAWRDPGFEPTNGIGVFGCGIGKGPCPAAWVPLAAGSALGRIAGSHGKAGIVGARPIKADLGAGGCTQHSKREQQAKTQLEPVAPHSRLSLAPPRRLSMLEKRAGAGECRLKAPSQRPQTHRGSARLYAG
jgi:hypothetical protein